MIHARWLGAAGLDLTGGGLTVMVDPYLTRAGFAALLARRPLPPRSAAVADYLARLPGHPVGLIAGHTHFDHVLDFPEILQRTGVSAVGSESLRTYLAACGHADRAVVARAGESVALTDTVAVTMLPSRHATVMLGRVPYPGEIEPGGQPPFSADYFRHGAIFAPLVTMGDARVLHLGSANLIDSALAGVECDAVFVALPGWRRVREFVPRLLGAVRTRQVVLFHFDDLTAPLRVDRTAPILPFLDLPEFAAEVRRVAPKVAVVVPRLYEAIPIGF